MKWPMRAISKVTFGCVVFNDDHILLIDEAEDKYSYTAVNHEGNVFTIGSTEVLVKGVAVSTTEQERWLMCGPQNACGKEAPEDPEDPVLAEDTMSVTFKWTDYY